MFPKLGVHCYNNLQALCGYPGLCAHTLLMTKRPETWAFGDCAFNVQMTKGQGIREKDNRVLHLRKAYSSLPLLA